MRAVEEEVRGETDRAEAEGARGEAGCGYRAEGFRGCNIFDGRGGWHSVSRVVCTVGWSVGRWVSGMIRSSLFGKVGEQSLGHIISSIGALYRDSAISKQRLQRVQ